MTTLARAPPLFLDSLLFSILFASFMALITICNIVSLLSLLSVCLLHKVKAP